MADVIAKADTDPRMKSEFLRHRDRFNDLLDEPLMVRVGGIGADTKRDLFDTFLDGLYGHAGPARRDRVREWENLPLFADLEYQFLLVLAKFLVAVNGMASVCRGMLRPVAA